MTDRYDAMTPRKGKDGKTYWTKIGSMWPAKDGKDGFNLSLDALPLPDGEGRCTVSMFVPKPKDEHPPMSQRSSTNGTSARGRANADMGDEEIPF